MLGSSPVHVLITVYVLLKIQSGCITAQPKIRGRSKKDSYHNEYNYTKYGKLQNN